MKKSVKLEIKKLIKKLNLDCSIEQFKDKVNWICISTYYNLSEDFIREFQNKVDWYCISIHQILSEDFIRGFQNKVNWYFVSKYQILSENFIYEFQNKVNWYYISIYQILSENFIREFDLKIPESCWLYKSKQFKLEQLKNLNQYEIIDNNYIIAYKSVRKDYCSVFNRQHLYRPGTKHKSHCDCNSDNKNSFGLSAWTKEKALKYYNEGKLLKIKIDIDKIGVIVDDYKIRCSELEVLEEVK